MPSRSSPMSSGRATDAAAQLSSVQRSAGCVRIIFLCRKRIAGCAVMGVSEGEFICILGIGHGPRECGMGNGSVWAVYGVMVELIVELGLSI